MLVIQTFDAMLFDLDGVLANSEASIVAGWTRWCEGKGLTAADFWRVRRHGMRSIDLVKLLAPDCDAAAESALIDRYEEEGANTVTPLEGAIDLIASLPADRWGVVTSGVRSLAEARLRAIGVPIPAVLIPADEVTAGKPDPEGYRRAAERLDVPIQRCLVIEDAPTGILAARAAGAAVLAVALTHDPMQLTEADWIVPDLTAVKLAGTSDDGLNVAIEAFVEH